jgi:hypothetical protein
MSVGVTKDYKLKGVKIQSVSVFNFFISVVKRAQLWVMWMGQWERKSTLQKK